MDDVSMQDVFMILAVLFGIMLVSLICAVIVKKSRDSKDEACPIQKKKAKVLEKDQLPPGTVVSLSEMNILFEIEGRQRLRLRAKAQNQLMPGDEGYLTWQGSKVINFERI